MLKYKRRNTLSGTGVIRHILKYKRSNHYQLVFSSVFQVGDSWIPPDQMMSHGGSTDLRGSVEVYNIGALGEKNSHHAVEVAAFITVTY
jgi:hypothetical protein